MSTCNSQSCLLHICKTDSKAQIHALRPKSQPVHWKQNYPAHWVSSSILSNNHYWKDKGSLQFQKLSYSKIWDSTCMWNLSCPNEGTKEAEDLEPLSAMEMCSTEVRDRVLAVAKGMKMPSPYEQSTPWELISNKTPKLQLVKIN